MPELAGSSLNTRSQDASANARLREKSLVQLEEYVDELSKENGEEIRGFLTDGRTIAEIQIDRVTRLRGPFRQLNRETLTRLAKTVISLELSAFRADNLVRDFCGSASDGALFQLARTFEETLRASSTDKTLCSGPSGK